MKISSFLFSIPHLDSLYATTQDCLTESKFGTFLKCRIDAIVQMNGTAKKGSVKLLHFIRHHRTFASITNLGCCPSSCEDEGIINTLVFSN